MGKQPRVAGGRGSRAAFLAASGLGPLARLGSAPAESPSPFLFRLPIPGTVELVRCPKRCAPRNLGSKAAPSSFARKGFLSSGGRTVGGKPESSEDAAWSRRSCHRRPET